MRRFLIIGGVGCGGLVVLGLFFVVLVAVLGDGTETANSPVEEAERERGAEEQQEAAPEPEPEPEPEPQPDPHPHFDAGMHRVGTDIQPGTYRTRTASVGCYWARLAGFGGDLNESIANGNADGPAVVTIAPTDAGFESNECATWNKLE